MHDGLPVDALLKHHDPSVQDSIIEIDAFWVQVDEVVGQLRLDVKCQAELRVLLTEFPITTFTT